MHLKKSGSSILVSWILDSSNAIQATDILVVAIKGISFLLFFFRE